MSAIIIERETKSKKQKIPNKKYINLLIWLIHLQFIDEKQEESISDLGGQTLI